MKKAVNGGGLLIVADFGSNFHDLRVSGVQTDAYSRDLVHAP